MAERQETRQEQEVRWNAQRSARNKEFQAGQQARHKKNSPRFRVGPQVTRTALPGIEDCFYYIVDFQLKNMRVFSCLIRKRLLNVFSCEHMRLLIGVAESGRSHDRGQ